MEEITKYIYRIEDLKTCIKSQEAIVIYGAGDFGKRLVDYFFAIGEDARIKGIVVTHKKETDKEYRGIGIYEADTFLGKFIECYVVIATSLAFQEEIAKNLVKYNKLYCYMTENLYWEIGKEISSKTLVTYRGIDFLVAGFAKCGTTSLHNVMKNIEEIYVSEKKESQFFSWEDYNQKKTDLIDLFFDNIREGQSVGMIEPTFAKNAKQIFDFFGKEIKIIFLLRNPVYATFSLFKMHNRGGNAGLEDSYEKNGRFYDEMFEEYFKQCVSQGTYIYEYIHWIEQFWKYYPKEQIKIVFFEELIKNPESEIDDILEFVGVSTEYKCKEYPIVNKGDLVMADANGYALAMQMGKIKKERRMLGKDNIEKIHECQSQFLEIKKKYDDAEKIYGLRIKNEQKDLLEKYFNDSVRRLERALNRDLSEIWF